MPCTNRPVLLVKTKLKQCFKISVTPTVTGKMEKKGRSSSRLPSPRLGICCQQGFWQGWEPACTLASEQGTPHTLPRPSGGLETVEVTGKVSAVGWDRSQPRQAWQRYPEMTFPCWTANWGNTSTHPCKLATALPPLSFIS